MKKLKWLFLTLLLAMSTSSIAQITYYSRASGNWNTASTWSTTGFTGLPAATFPVAGDFVNIGGGFTVTITANQACATINFEAVSTTTNVLTFSGTNTLAVSGAVTLPKASTGSNWFDVAQGILNAGSIDFTGGDATPGSLHRLTATTGTITVTGNVTGSGVSGLISITDAGILRLGGALFDSSNGIVTGGTGSTVEYNGTNQTIQVHSYHHLRLSGSGTKSVSTPASTDFNIYGNLSVANGCTLSIGVIGVGSPTSSFHVHGTTAIGEGASGALNITSSFGNKTFQGLVTINSGAVWSNTTVNDAVNFRGGITLYGTFNPGTGTQSFSVNSQTLTGTFNIPAVSVFTSDLVLSVNGSLSANTVSITTNSAEILNNGTITINSGLTGSGSITQGAGSTLNLIGANTSLTGDINGASSGNTVSYSASADQPIISGEYADLAISGSGVKTMPSTIAINRNLSVSGSVSISGASTTLNFNGANQNLTGSPTLNVNNMQLSGSGTKTFNMPINVVATLTINNGTKAGFIAPTGYMAGSLVINGAPQVLGTYGSTLSAATNRSDNFFSGDGLITVSSGNSRTYYSISSGSWVSSATWSTLGFGYTENFGTFPMISDAVVLGNNATITANSVNSCQSITFSASTTVNTVLNLSGGSLTVSSITLPRASSGTNTLDVGSGVLQTGTIAFTTGGGGGHQVLISTGTVNASGDVSSSLTTAIVQFSGAGNLNLSGSFITSGTFTPFTGCTVRYVGSVSQNVRPVTYHHLVLSGSVKTTSSGNTNVNGNLLIEDNTFFSVGNSNLRVFGLTTVGTGSSGAIQFETSANGSKTFDQTVTVQAGATWSNAINESFFFGGGIVNNGTFIPGNGSYTFTATDNQSISGISSIPKLVVSTPGTVNLTVNGTLTSDSVAIMGASNSIINNGSFTVGSHITGTGKIMQNANATLFISAVGDLSNGINASALNNVVTYSGADQTVLSGNYHHLNLAGSGIKTLQVGTTTIAGNLDIEGTASVTAVTGITIVGNVTIGSTANFDGDILQHNVGGNWNSLGTFVNANGSVTFNGSSQSISNSANSQFYDLNLAGSGTKTFNTVVAIDGSLVINTGVVLNLGTFTTHTTRTLTTGSISKLVGTHGSTTPEPDPDYPDNTFFGASTGILTVEALVFYSKASTAWNLPSTWSNSTYGGDVALSTPSSADVVRIGNGYSITVTTNSSCTTLSFLPNVTSNGIITVSPGVSLSVIGNIIIPRASTSTGAVGGFARTNGINVGAGTVNAGNILFTNALGLSNQLIQISTGTLTVNGDVSGVGTASRIEIIGSTGLLKVYGSLFGNGLGTLNVTNPLSTVEYAGNNQTIFDRSYLCNLKISGSGTKTWSLGFDRTISGNFTVEANNSILINNSRQFNVIGKTDVYGSISISETATTAAPTRTFTGDVTIYTLGSWSESTDSPFIFNGNFVHNGLGYIQGVGPHTFGGTSKILGGAALTLSNPIVTGSYTTTGALTVNGNATGTGSLSMGASSTLNLSGTLSVSTFNASASGNTVNYAGAGAQTVVIPTSGQYFNLSFNNTTAAGIASPADSLSVIKVMGTWTNNGAAVVGGYQGFNPYKGTVEFNGTTPQSIQGSALSSFYTLTSNSSSTVNLLSNSVIEKALNILAGSLTNAGSMTVANKMTITRQSGSTFSGNAPITGVGPAGNSYNLVYIGSGNMSTGVEVLGTHVKDVTIGLTTATLTQTNAMNLFGIMRVNANATYDPGNNLLTIESWDDTGTDAGGSIGTIAGSFLTNPVIVERYFRAVDNVDRFISSPVTNAPVSQLQAAFPVTGKFTGSSYPCDGCLNNGNSLRWYRESSTGILNKGYNGYPTTNNSATLTPGVGYDAWMWHGINPTTISFSGPINQGNINGLGTDGATGQVLSRTANGVSSADGWNLIGNPYPAPIRWTGSSTGGWDLSSNIDAVAWAWDVYNGVWVAIRSTVPNPLIPYTDQIAIGQAFWVRVNSGSTGFINITEAAKSSARSGAYYRERNTTPMLKVSLSDRDATETAYLTFHENASEYYSSESDFSKIELGIERMHMTLVKDGNNLGFYGYNDRMENDIPIRIMAENEGVYELSFETIDDFNGLDNYYLIDVVTNERIAFSPTLKYSFVYSKSHPEQRFILSRKSDLPSTQAGLVQAYPNPTTGKLSLLVNGMEPIRSLVVLNSAGETVNTQAIEQSGNIELSLQDYPSGVYFVKLAFDSGVVVKRVIKY